LLFQGLARYNDLGNGRQLIAVRLLADEKCAGSVGGGFFGGRRLVGFIQDSSRLVVVTPHHYLQTEVAPSFSWYAPYLASLAGCAVLQG